MFGRLLARLRSWVGRDGAADTGDDTDGVEGSGAEYRAPAYNGRYEAEREVDRIAEDARRIENEDEDEDVFDPGQS